MRLFRRALVLLAVPAIVFFAGPRHTIDWDSVIHPTLPEKLEGYIEGTEGRIPDLIDGAEREIVWFREAAKTALAVVYLHGFSATRQEIEPVVSMVGEQLQANVFFARLRGHGRTGQALGDAKAEHWLADAQEALRVGERIGNKVILIGSSTGGALAYWLATSEAYSENVHALVLLSPYFANKNKFANIAAWPWGKHLTYLLMGKTRQWTPRNEGEGQYWTTQYKSDVLVELVSMIKAINNIEESQQKSPCLVFLNANDQVVDANLTREKFARMQTDKKLLSPVKNTQDVYGHVLAGQILSPQTTNKVTREIVDFIVGLAP